MIRRMTKLKTTIEKGVTDLRQPTLAPVNFTVSQDMMTYSDGIDSIKDHMKEIVKSMKKQAKVVENDVSSGAQLSDVFDTFAKSMVTVHPTGPQPQVASCLRDAASFMQKLNDMTMKLEEKVQQVLCTTLETFITEGLKPTIEKKRQYDREAMDYDGMITKHKNLKKSGKTTPAKEKESEQQLAETREMFLQEEKETLELLKQANAKGEALTITKIVEYWDSMATYFKEGAKFLETMQPKIERYKKHLKEAANAQRAGANASAGPSAAAVAKTFKQPLGTICQRESRRVPIVIVASCAYLLQNGLDVQGIFRVSPTKDILDDLKLEIDNGQVDWSFANVSSPHVISGLLKAYVRELPDPLFTFERYSIFMDAVKLDSPEAQIATLSKHLKSLPTQNYKCLQHISKMCVAINACKEENKMHFSNLATVLTPNLLYTLNMDPNTIVQEMETANRVYTTILENYEVMFPEDDLANDALPVAAPTSPAPGDVPPTHIPPLPTSIPPTPPLLALDGIAVSGSSPGTPSSPLSSSTPNLPSIGEVQDESGTPTSPRSPRSLKPRRVKTTVKLDVSADSIGSNQGLDDLISPKDKRKGNKSGKKRRERTESSADTTEVGDTSIQSSIQAIEALRRTVHARNPSGSNMDDLNAEREPVSSKYPRPRRQKSYSIVTDRIDMQVTSPRADFISPRKKQAATESSTSSSDKSSTLSKSDPHTSKATNNDLTKSAEAVQPVTPTEQQDIHIENSGEIDVKLGKEADSGAGQSPKSVSQIQSQTEAAPPHPGNPGVKDPKHHDVEESQITSSQEVPATGSQKQQEGASDDEDLNSGTPAADSTTEDTPAPIPSSPSDGAGDTEINLDDEDIPDSVPTPVLELAALLDSNYTSLVDSMVSLIHASNASYDTHEELVSSLGRCTRDLALQCRSLLASVPTFVSNFPETEAQIESSAQSLQSILRDIIVCVKNASGDPEAIPELNEKIGEFASCTDEFRKAMFDSSIQQLQSLLKASVVKSTSHVAPVLRAIVQQNVEDSLEDAQDLMKKDLAKALHLAGCLAPLITNSSSAHSFDTAVASLVSSVDAFWTTALSYNTSDDPPSVSQTLIQDARTLLSNSRSLETAIGEASASDIPELAIIQDELWTSISALTKKINSSSQIKLSTRLMVLGCQKTLKGMLDQAHNWSNEIPTCAQAVENILSFSQTSNKVLSHMNYHILESEDVSADAIGQATGISIQSNHLLVCGVMLSGMATDSNYAMCLQVILRVVQLVQNIMFGAM